MQVMACFLTLLLLFAVGFGQGTEAPITKPSGPLSGDVYVDAVLKIQAEALCNKPDGACGKPVEHRTFFEIPAETKLEGLPEDKITVTGDNEKTGEILIKKEGSTSGATGGGAGGAPDGAPGGATGGAPGDPMGETAKNGGGKSAAGVDQDKTIGTIEVKSDGKTVKTTAEFSAQFIVKSTTPANLLDSFKKDQTKVTLSGTLGKEEVSIAFPLDGASNAETYTLKIMPAKTGGSSSLSFSASVLALAAFVWN